MGWEGGQEAGTGRLGQPHERRGGLCCPPAHSRSRPLLLPSPHSRPRPALANPCSPLSRGPSAPSLPLAVSPASRSLRGTPTRSPEAAQGARRALPPTPSTPPATAAPGALGYVCLSFVLQFLPQFLVSPLPRAPFSFHTIFLFEESSTIHTNCFLLAKAKRKSKGRKKLQTASQAPRRKRATPKPQGKRKTQFLRKRT